jgi:site-specific recombinase XerD
MIVATVTTPDDAPWLLEPFAQQLQWERNLAPTTLTAYRREVARFAGFAAAELDRIGPDAVEPVDVRAYLAWLHAQGLTAASVQRALAALRTYFRFLLAEGAVRANPARVVPHPRRERKLRRW